MNRVAIIAAMPGELKTLVSAVNWKKKPTRHRAVHKWISQNPGATVQWIAVCAGMGADAVTRAFAEAEAEGPINSVVSIGWAGALQEDGYPGELCIPNVVVNAQTGERSILAERAQDSVLVTTAHVADEPEKRRLAQTYNGRIVDMESATVFRLAQMRSIPVFCIKVTTDEVTAKLPDLNPFIDAMGQMQLLKFIGYVILRPYYWPALMRLGRASSKAADVLSDAVHEFLDCPDPSLIDEINRTGNIPD